jgi:hypothetical protein
MLMHNVANADKEPEDPVKHNQAIIRVMVMC